MKKTIIFLILICFISTASAETQNKWWLAKPMRLIQTNLRDIDADIDIDRYIRDIREYNAEAVMFNIGGIVAFYPTELKYHYRNDYLKNDIVKQLSERLHAEGIRALGRFDFSKLNEKLAFQKPEWLYKGVKGNFVNYNGQVHTCINGGYQQEYIFKIMGEVFDRYELDGIYFNMVGYHTWDYSGNQHGICQSDACKKRFKECSGGDTLPVKEDYNDEVFRKFIEFKRVTSGELFTRIRKFIRSKNPDSAVLTWGEEGVDIIRYESSSALWRQMEWTYSGSDNVKRSLGSWKDKACSNVTIPFIDFPYRHSAVSPWLTQLRLVGSLVNGGWLDYVAIGRLDNQADRRGLNKAKDVFQFHAKNDKWFSNTESAARVCLVRADFDEYKGLFNILAENGIVFDVINTVAMEQKKTRRPLNDYQMVILPNVTNLSDHLCTRLDDYVSSGGLLLATGKIGINDRQGNPKNKIRLRSLGVKTDYINYASRRGTYFNISGPDKKLLKNKAIGKFDIVYLDSDYLECTPSSNTKKLLGFIPPAMFGPPEKCYYNEITKKPGLFLSHFGTGKAIFFPWNIGKIYTEEANPSHSTLFTAAIEGLLGFEKDIVVEAGPLVEVTRHKGTNGKFEWVGLVNHSGQNQAAFHKPLPIYSIPVKLRTDRPVKTVHLLRAGKKADFTFNKGWLKCTIPTLERFEIVVFEYKAGFYKDKKMYKKLTKEEERVIIHKGTEKRFSGKFDKHHDKGTYTCKQCGKELFDSSSKFESGCGWPSFDDQIEDTVKKQFDRDGVRTEIVCAECDGHLGHVFLGEGYTPKNTRYCVNSVSIDFTPEKSK